MRIAICDDEKAIRDQVFMIISPYLQESTDIELYRFNSGEEFLGEAQKKAFDLVYLDIELAGMNGVQTANILRKMNDSTILIFITSHIEFVSETFRVGAFQFIRKPIDKVLFCEEYERAVAQYRKAHHIYRVQAKNEIACVEIMKILYIESYHGTLFLHSAGSPTKIEFSGNLSTEENKLSLYGFVKCHQGFLVNIQHIQKIGKNFILLDSNESIPMSRRQSKQILEKYHNYLFEKGI